MKFTIYGLRIASTGQVISIGQTMQDLRRRLAKHIERSRQLFDRVTGSKEQGVAIVEILLHGKIADVYHRGSTYGDKAQAIVTLLDMGEHIEIFEVERVEAQPCYNSGGACIMPLEVFERERYWQNRYLTMYDRPMFLNGMLV